MMVVAAGCVLDPKEEGDGDPTCVDGLGVAGQAGTTWISICGGTYYMGSNDDSSEQPVHQVDVPTFEMLASEVTVEQYQHCVEEGVCREPDDGESCNWGDPAYEDHPINCVRWTDARDYCEWLGARLPSESEWEYAARSGGQDIPYPWGEEEADCGLAVMDVTGDEDGCGTDRTYEVCWRDAGHTEQGLCDMSGNVREWMQDWLHACYDCALCPLSEGCTDPDVAPSDGSAWDAENGASKILRGGSFQDEAIELRTTARSAMFHGDYGGLGPTMGLSLGFRCAR